MIIICTNRGGKGMNEQIKYLKTEQLSWIIENHQTKKNFYLLKYVFDLLMSENSQSKNIKKKLEESFEYAKNNNDFIYNYINCLSNKINTDKINELKSYKDYYSIISEILITCDKNNIFDVNKKYELIKITMDELKFRKEFFNHFFVPYEGISNLEELIQDDLTLFIHNNDKTKLDNDMIKNYQTYLQEDGRLKYASYILGASSSDIISNNYYQNLTFYPFKPNVEGELQTYFLSLIMDWLIPRNAFDSMPAYNVILKLEDEIAGQNDELLKYAIEEKTVDHIRQTYNKLCKYRENNELLSVIGIEEFYQNEEHASKLNNFEKQIQNRLKDNDMLPLGQFNSKEMSTEMKKKIQDIWNSNIHEKLYPLFLYWLNGSEELFQEVYDKNKTEFKKIIKDYVTFDRDSEEDVYRKLEVSIVNTTYKVLCENEQKLSKCINSHKMHELPLINQKEKEVACFYLKYILSGLTSIINPLSDNISQEVKNQFKDVNPSIIEVIIRSMNSKNEYLGRYPYYNGMPIDNDTKINNISYISLLESNLCTLKELSSLIKKMLSDEMGIVYGLNDDSKTKLQVQSDIYRSLEIYDILYIKPEELNEMLYVVEKEQEKYNFYTCIKNYFQILGADDETSIKLRNQLIEHFYNEYSKTMNILSIYDEKFTKYLTLEAENFIYKEIKNKNDINDSDIIFKFIKYMNNAIELYYNENNTKKASYKKKKK